MNPLTSTIIEATRKATKLLRRDFFELEFLQSSSKNSLLFCQRSVSRTKDTLRNDLAKLQAQVIFVDEYTEPTANLVLIIEPIDSIDNLARSLPFFAMTITCYKSIQGTLAPACSIMVFPALGDIYYTEKGSGAWLDQQQFQEKTNLVRLRVSQRAQISDMMVATDSQILPNIESRNMRSFGSPSYGLSLLLGGKVDAMVLSNFNPILKAGFTLFTEQAGGVVSVDNEQYFALTNFSLADKMRQIITEV